MERNILQTVALALMLVALCPVISKTMPDSSSAQNSSPTMTTTMERSTTISTPGTTTPPIAYSTESSPTATTPEEITKSHETEISSTSTEGSTETSTPSEETERSTAISPSGTPPITSPTESSTTAITFKGNTKSHETTSTEGSTETPTPSEETERSTAISPSGTPPITSPTESSTTAITFEGNTKSHETEIFTASTEGTRESSTSSGENERSTATSPPGTTPTAAPTEHPSTNFNITYHIAMNFSNDLSNSSSEAYHNLTRIIGKMYEDIYNCSTCPAKYGTYLGFTVNGFSNGSVVANTTVHFQESANVSTEVISTALSNATEDQLQGLSVTQIEVTKQETPPTPSPTPTSTSSKTTTAKPPIVQTFTITYHIAMNFTDDLLNSSSEAYRNLTWRIGRMYEDVFNCSTCPTVGKYITFTVNSFSNGSVVANTTVHFQESAEVSSEQLRTALSNATENQRQGLTLTQIEVTKQETPTPSPTTASTSSKTTTAKPAIEQTFTITYHITMNFTDDLLNSSSEAFRNLTWRIAKMYEEVFNCSGCPAEGKYIGYTVNSFSNGSVVANTTVHFQDSANVSSEQLRTALSNATEDQRQGLTLTQIEVTKQETPPTPSPTPTSTSSKTTTAKPPIVQTFTITYHIAMNFTDDLLNSSSEAYRNLTWRIGRMYEDVFNCSTCPTVGKYITFTVNSFSNGSVVANTTVHFQESAEVSSEQLRTALSNATENQRQGLTLTQIEVTKQETPTPSPTTASTSSKTTTAKPAIEQTFTITYHITMNFTDDLLNSSSEAFRNLTWRIAKMYEEVFNCSGCPAEGKYIGYTVNSFSNGSVVANTTVHFQDSANVSSEQLRTALSNATEDQRQGLTLTQIEVTKQETPPTPSPTPTSTSSKTTTAKPPIVQTFTITYHIAMNFTDDLLNSSSEAYRNLTWRIGRMYEDVFNCSTCPTVGKYITFTVNSFSNGSVVANTTVHFQESANVSSEQLRTALSNATEDQRQGLTLTQIEVTKQETPTPSPITASTSSKTTTAKPPIGQTFTITYHITMNFTDDLLNSSSEAYHNLTGRIEMMYQEVYNCSTCPYAGVYVGFTVNSFRNGSVVANTTLRFKESAKVSKDELHKALSNAPEDKRQGLNLTKIEVTSDTTEPPTSTTPSPPATTPTTTSTTLPSLMYFSLSYRIEMVFTEDYLNPSSRAYNKLQKEIGEMYKEVYNCSGCSTAGRYNGYTVNSFRSGSVVADTTLWFVAGKSISSEELRTALSQASPGQRQNLILTNIEVRNLGSDTPNRPETVPGWGIALLVLVCILLLLALIAFLIQIIHWCRRNHRGKLDLLSNQDSYHIMSEYPTYHTHGRYVAPGSKPNPYSETLPRNGNAPFSYTNPTMANDEL